MRKLPNIRFLGVDHLDAVRSCIITNRETLSLFSRLQRYVSNLANICLATESVIPHCNTRFVISSKREFGIETPSDRE